VCVCYAWEPELLANAMLFILVSILQEFCSSCKYRSFANLGLFKKSLPNNFDIFVHVFHVLWELNPNKA